MGTLIVHMKEFDSGEQMMIPLFAEMDRPCKRCGDLLPAYAFDGDGGRICLDCKHATRYADLRDGASLRWRRHWQRNSCAICGLQFEQDDLSSLVIDHDHQTNRVRGLLCNPCNLMLGLAGDDAQRLHAAADYLDATARGSMPIHPEAKAAMSESGYQAVRRLVWVFDHIEQPEGDRDER